MILMTVQGVSKSFGMKSVLKDISLTLQQGARMGLIGVNGSGKSTLFRLIAGQMEPDEGSISLMRGTRVGMLTQEADIQSDLTVREELSRVFEPVREMERRLRALEEEMAQKHADEAELDRLSREYARLTDRFEDAGGYEWPSRIQGVLAGLGFAKGREDQPASVLSGGEKTRLCLARLLLTQPDLLMLDEPTNHLDLSSIQWLEDTLKKYRGTVLIISHDRYFMNSVCDCMAEISMRRLVQYEGNYDQFTVKRQADIERQIREYKLQQAEIARQQAIIQRYRMYNREKSIRAAESREKRLEKMERLERPVDEQHVRFSFEVRRRTGDDVLKVHGLAKGFEGRRLFENFDLHLRAGDRVAIIGPNGVGKSTLLNIIARKLKADAGEVEFGANVDLGYYEQHQTGLDPEKDVLNELWDAFPRLDLDRVRSVLALFIYFTMLFNGGLVASYLLITKTLMLQNTIWVLLFPSLCNAWNILLMRNFFNGIPDSLAESAKIDGANDIIILFRIIIPISLPGIATIGLFYALSYWNEWYKCLLYIDSNHSQYYTLQYLIQRILRQVNYAANQPAEAVGLNSITLPTYAYRMATVVVSTGPIILLYPFLQKYFVQGLTVGAVKG